ncbi:MAG TPA: D-alanine--D-alanine ligase family protein [Vicinamibacterales bacterium]|nr:D-alanine--D-alanine ligase family protein [Vicinamibacterales bacterium]
MTKLRVGIIFGGRSGEHEVSVTSAASIFKHIDRTKYEPVAIHIQKDGKWTLPAQPPTALSAAEVIQQARLAPKRVTSGGPETLLAPYPTTETMITVERAGANSLDRPVVSGLGLDVVFPVLHGPYGEDGTVQGLLELANIPYVGPGVLASAAGMDKAVMKVLFAGRGLPVCASHDFVRAEWDRDRDRVLSLIDRLGLPVFVKPANLGSSVGISKVKSRSELVPAIEMALDFDRKVIVEAAVPNAREIECAVLGNNDPEASVPGEIIPSREFYDYEAKYLDEGSKSVIPADLPPGTIKEVQRLSIEAFRAIDAAGLARVDFLLSRDNGRLYLNEINTMPGFTTISMYAQMWQASGVSYSELVDRLIQLGLERHAEKQKLKTSAL